MTIVAALDNPLAVLMADDLSDVVRPNHDSAHRRATGAGTVMCPGARQIVLRPGIRTYLRSHVPTAPCGWTAAVSVATRVTIMVVTTRITMVVGVVMGVCLRARRERKSQCGHSHKFTHRTDFLVVEGKAIAKATGECRVVGGS